MQLFIVYCLLFIVGAAVGSFLNVVIDRLETDETILTGRSHCDSCGTTLRWYDLIPILSFVLLRGRCRYCRGKLKLQYPLVELATGIVFLLIYQSPFLPHSHCIPTLFPFRNAIGIPWRCIGVLVYFYVLASSLIVIFVYDLKHKIIPDQIVLPAIFVSFIFVILSAAKNPDGISRLHLEMTLISAVLAGLFFLTLILVTRGRGMGFGDVKLAFLMGLILGWPKILIALYLSFISGALVGLFLIAIGKKRFGQETPFGPFLSASTITTLLYGEFLLNLFQILV